MKLTTNLATRRYLNLRQLNALLIALFVLLGGLLIFEVRELAYNQAELVRIRRATASSGGARGAEVSEAQLSALAPKIRFANTLIEKKSVDWLKLLDSLEQVVPAGVMLHQIDPPQRDQVLQISGSARNFGNLRALLENMEESKNFSEVYLLSQSETKVGLTQQGINFSINCKIAY